ncbi:hypothetical protein KI659_17650 [Litoribacter alkaliphilus]|uniref:phospholipase D n=1 Tax=Litoribacter ruber TaxID=702568 RepID=A0AAP2CKZ8_9BACT|nr:phospholipase D-like domain-containing protein [Litoribacter alkaliphilus]MBS9525850.1 hypothetical protein [Litoribacter alkaliphilus]
MDYLNGVSQPLDQEVIFDNTAIHQRILDELAKATNYIYVATAWFTDPSLLGALEEKAREGVKVEVIFSDNSANEKLDFSGLKNLGGIVMKIKKSGFGIMHQKFCVIDGRIAISGTYNWSVNAKNNNDESIFISTLHEIIGKYVEHFNKIKGSTEEVKPQNKFIKNLLKGMLPKGKEKAISSSGEEVLPISKKEEEKFTPRKHEYELILDQMIAAEVSNFDRGKLKEEGYQRSKANNGDHQVLGSALDSVYSVFINDINVVEDKKNRLKSKIKEEEIKSIDAEKEKAELQLNTLEIDMASLDEYLISRIVTTKTQVETLENEKKEIEEVEISSLEQKIVSLKESIQALQIEFVKPKIKLFNAIPYGLFLFGTLAYLFIFYSSAAYILVFGEEDFKLARMNDAPVPPPEIFNPNAISLAFERGWVSLAFILLFVFIPLGISICDRLIDKFKKLAFFSGVVIVDVSIAYKVAESLHNINYELGRVDEIWHWTHSYQDTNFYLVFVFGAFGLIMFKYLYKRFIEIFESRDSDLDKQKKMALAQQKQGDIDQHRERIKEFQEELILKDNEILFVKNEIQTLTSTKEFLPSKKANRIEKIKAELNIRIQNIERITTIYSSHIDNDILPISIDSINDRINIYLEGWSNYLHDQYNVNIAMEKGQKALEEARKWKVERVEKKLIDTRILK